MVDDSNISICLHSDEAIGLHRLVIAESRRFPELAERFYDQGPRRYIAAIDARLPEDDADGDQGRAEALFALLFGEPHPPSTARTPTGTRRGRFRHPRP